jgi:hypothetical protein
VPLGFFSTNTRSAATKNEQNDASSHNESNVIDFTPVTDEKGIGATAITPAVNSSPALVLCRKNERMPPIRPRRNAAEYAKRETKTQKTKSFGRQQPKSGLFAGKLGELLGRNMYAAIRKRAEKTTTVSASRQPTKARIRGMTLRTLTLRIRRQASNKQSVPYR